MANLIFCTNQDSMEIRRGEITGRGAAEPFMMKNGSDITGAIEALREGRDVVAQAGQETVTGWRAPEGTVIALDDELENATDQPRAALAAQARSRVPQDVLKLHPHQIRTIEAIKNMSQEELSDRLGQIGSWMQTGDRIHRVGRTQPEVRTVSLESIMRQLDAKRDAQQVIPAHDLDEGLQLVNAGDTTGTLVIAMDRLDAFAECAKHDGAFSLNEPSWIGAASEVLDQGGVVVAVAGLLPCGAGRKTGCEIRMTELAMRDAGAARVAIRMCRERLGPQEPEIDDDLEHPT
jgi:hypothetical protein